MTKFRLKIAIALFLIAFTSGCAVRTIIGASRWDLQSEKIKYSRSINKDLSYCYENTLKIFDTWEAAVVEKKDKEYVIALNFDGVFSNCINTTAAGIFFKELEPNKTEIEVSSLNHNLSQFVSEKLPQYLENPDLNPLKILSRKKFGYNRR